MRLIFLISFFLHSFSLWGLTILIDPGHGGEDLGAKSSHLFQSKTGKKVVPLFEKDLALVYAKKLKEKLDPFYTVYLTRSVDKTISLQDRAAMADRLKVDLFISIHLNAAKQKSSAGFEIYFLDNRGNKGAKKLEQTENQSFSGDQVVHQILADLVVKKTQPKSKKLSNYLSRQVNRKIGKRFKVSNRGVKKGLFYVLALSKRPSVLIELGFMSNKKELTKLLDPKFQASYVTAMAQAIHEYRSDQLMAQTSTQESL